MALHAEVFRVVVLEARQVKTTLSSMRNKTDRDDARGIAQILRPGWYRQARAKSSESQQLKTPLAARKALSRRHLDLENEVRGLMKVYGRKLTDRVRHGKFESTGGPPRGFHLFEPGNAFRSTDGDALVPAALFAGVHGVCALELHVGCTARYVADAAVA
jgi:transposase